MKKIVAVSFAVLLVVCAGGQSAWGNSISNIRLDPPTPATLAFGQQVNVSFDYRGIETRGLRIFVRPYSGRRPTPRYAAEGSPSYRSGSGHGSGEFTIRPGDPVTVDAISISVRGNNGRELLFEFFLPAAYTFAPERRAAARGLQMRAERPAQLHVSDKVNIQKQPGVVRLKKSPPLVGPRLMIRPDLTEKLVPRLPPNFQAPGDQVLRQQVPSIRPPDSPPGTDEEWNGQMNNWLDQLNLVLLNEITLVVGNENTVQDLVNFEEGEKVSVYDQVGLRLWFLRLTQFQRMSEAPNEDNP